VSATASGDDPATIRVLAAVIERNGRYLICQRPLHKRHGGLWEFPGGKLEAGESDAHAAHRELREELGVRVTSVGKELFGIREQGAPFHIAFVEVEVEGEPSCLEHTAIQWAAPSELLDFALAPSDQRFAERITGGAPGVSG